jgi:hypothetical protein
VNNVQNSVKENFLNSKAISFLYAKRCVGLFSRLAFKWKKIKANSALDGMLTYANHLVAK